MDWWNVILLSGVSSSGRNGKIIDAHPIVAELQIATRWSLELPIGPESKVSFLGAQPIVAELQRSGGQIQALDSLYIKDEVIV